MPLIRNPAYRDHFVERCAAFWRPFADRAAERGVTIVLENLWEEGPELQRAVVDAADHPARGASFDNGHALVFGKAPAAVWIEGLGPALRHVHLHDNDRSLDQHRPVGEGAEDWPALLGALAAYAPDALVVLETDDLEKNRRSVDGLRALGR